MRKTKEQEAREMDQAIREFLERAHDRLFPEYRYSEPEMTIPTVAQHVHEFDK